MGRVVSLCLLGFVVLASPSLLGQARQAESIGKTVQVRRPIALESIGDEVWVANRESASLSRLDRVTGAVRSESRIGRRLADMARLNARSVLLIDDLAGALLSVEQVAESIVVRELATIPKSSVKLLVAREKQIVFIASTWSHEVLVLKLDRAFRKVLQRSSVPLPFAPRELLDSGTDQLLVADAFGGKLAVVQIDSVDIDSCRVQAVRDLHAHNIRGLALSDDGQRVFVAQQRLHKALTDYEELHWGRTLSNAVQVVDLEQLLKASTSAAATAWLDKQGGIGGAMGDPSDVVLGANGVRVLAFSGSGEIAIQSRQGSRRVRVGRGPGAMLLDDDRVFVANRFDDSVSLVDLASPSSSQTVSLGQSPKLSAAQRGEILFFDATLSHDSWMSCHSCHTDGHSSGLLVDTLGDGDYGAPKRVPSLLGTRGTGPWGWTARSKTLADQVRQSIESTMHGDPRTEGEISDLVAYLRSLKSAPPRKAPNAATVERGRLVFEDRDCSSCHGRDPAEPSKDASASVFDVGLKDENGRRRFNPPSLRGVSQRPRLFHDGRAKSLGEVLRKFEHPGGGEPYTTEELEALLGYLRSL